MIVAPRAEVKKIILIRYKIINSFFSKKLKFIIKFIDSESYDMCTSCPANSNFYDVDGDGFGVCLCDFESDLFAEGWNCVSVCPSKKNYKINN